MLDNSRKIALLASRRAATLIRLSVRTSQQYGACSFLAGPSMAGEEGGIDLRGPPRLPPPITDEILQEVSCLLRPSPRACHAACHAESVYLYIVLGCLCGSLTPYRTPRQGTGLAGSAHSKRENSAAHTVQVWWHADSAIHGAHGFFEAKPWNDHTVLHKAILWRVRQHTLCSHAC